MKPFRFALQAVLTVRTNQENVALQAFSIAHAEYRRIAALHEALRNEIEVTLGSRRDMLSRIASSEQVQALQHGLRALQSKLRHCEAELQKAQEVMDEKSRGLMKARQGREVVDKLYERQFLQHQADAGRAEQKAMDELAAMKSVGNFALKWR